MPASPITGGLTADTDIHDVYKIWLAVGQEITFVLTEPPGGDDFDLRLYGPAATDISVSTPLRYLDTGDYPESIEWTAGVAGYYYLDVWNFDNVTDTYVVYYNVVYNYNVPGVPLPASPVYGELNDAFDDDDVYYFFMHEGDEVTFTLQQPVTPSDLDLWLYGPGTTDIFSDPELVWLDTGQYPEIVEWTAEETGYYFLDVNNYTPLVPFDQYTIDWSIAPQPLTTVWRFYNVTNGTHFFTSSLDEANHVLATWPTIFKLDGVAYQDNPLTNNQPLYRFYNKVSKSHFYTASAEEADHVIATWPTIFNYEGPTYAVRAAPASPFDLPVYRFFNKRTGSHFYTASAEEADHVIATWPDIYQYDGIAYYLGQ